MSDVKQISVFLENRPGSLTEFTKILRANEINMKALNLAEIADYGVLRLIVDDNYKLVTVLKDEGYVFNTTPVIACAVPDKPGSLVKILELLSEENINLEYTYAFLSRKSDDEAFIILRVEDTESAKRVLSSNDVKVLSEEEVGDM